MTPGTMVPVPSNRIEVYPTITGTLVLFCGRCQEETYEGQMSCCPWSLEMFDRYFHGVKNVSDSSILNTNG
jgi:hypothetical protein